MVTRPAKSRSDSKIRSGPVSARTPSKSHSISAPAKPFKSLQAREASRESVEVIIRGKLYGEAPQEKHFITSDGRRLKNVKEPLDALETMGDEVFSSHVNDFKNDFSTWLKDVFSFEGMAKELESANHRLDAQRVLMKNLIREIEEKPK